MSGIYANNTLVVAAKTASYQIVPDDIGKLFTNRGAGAITLTLPKIADVQTGWNCRFFTVSASILTIAAEANSIVTFNNATTCDSIGLGDSADIIGNGCEFVSDGTSWLVFLNMEETATLTVTTS